MRKYLFLLPLIITACTAVAEPVRHESFDAILKATVRNERIDYMAVRTKHMSELNAYLSRMAQVDVNGLSRDEQLAYYINLYNATMIKAVVERYKPGYSPADNDFTVFKEKLVHLKGSKVTLDHLEHKIIRPTFKDPRIHAALVCGAVSCPPLLNRVYRADDLNKVLDNNMKKWIANDSSRNKVDHRTRNLHLSQIFNWFAEDFGGKDNVANFVNPHFEEDVSGYRVQFLEYDWALNITR